jgi:hypothetical protein
MTGEELARLYAELLKEAVREEMRRRANMIDEARLAGNKYLAGWHQGWLDALEWVLQKLGGAET